MYVHCAVSGKGKPLPTYSFLIKCALTRTHVALSGGTFIEASGGWSAFALEWLESGELVIQWRTCITNCDYKKQ